MHKLIPVLMLICLPLVLVGCSKDREKQSDASNLFDQASPESSVIIMSVFDGTTGTYGSFCDLEGEQHIVDMLNRVAAVKAENWTPELIKFPAYGFEIGSKDGNGYRAFWSDGYLVMRDGSVYKFDFDFSKIWNEHEWQELYKVLGSGEIINVLNYSIF